MSNFDLTPGKVTRRLLLIVTILLMGHLTGLYFKFQLNSGALGLVGAFGMDHEKNVPALYSAVAILFCAWILWMIAKLPDERAKKRSAYWKVMGGVFTFLALDEFFSFHEELIDRSKNAMGGDSVGNGFFYYPWFVPYGIFFSILSVFFIKFFFSLPAITRKRFIISVCIFGLGAVGMEMLGGKYVFETGQMDFRYNLIVAVEETLEMLGIISFISALMKYYLNAVPGSAKILIHVHADTPTAGKSKRARLAGRSFFGKGQPEKSNSELTIH